MMAVPKIDPEQARRSMEQGAILVCAYDEAEKCQRYHLEGAMSLKELEGKEASIPKNRELLFYCA
jgi:hypothetical protein